MGLAEQIVHLAKLEESAGPVVSVYLNTRWTDEHQRERTRLFLKGQLRRSREANSAADLAPAFDWIQAEGEALISQASRPDAHGVALFAGRARGLREVLPVRAPVENAFVVADGPFLGPLAAALAEAPAALVVFVDAKSARLIPVLADGPGEEIRLDSEVPRHHRRGGWAQLAQSRYQRHIEERRGRHLEAVAEALCRLAEENGVERIVVAGSPDSAAALQRALPPRVAGRVAGTVAGSRHEPANRLVTRATDVIGRIGALEAGAAVDVLLTDAAKGGQAVAGLDEVLEAVQRGAVDRLYLLRDFREDGRACVGCAAIQPGPGAMCRLCGQATVSIELGEAMVTRTITAGGAVTIVNAHPELARVGGVGARLRFAL
jgi:peptide subunit release factor 1 (eRF1)